MGIRNFINLLESIPTTLTTTFILIITINFIYIIYNKETIKLKNRLKDYNLIYSYNINYLNNYDLNKIKFEIDRLHLGSYSFTNMKNIDLLNEKGIDQKKIFEYIENVNKDLILLANSIKNNHIINITEFNTLYNSLFESMMYHYFKLSDINNK